jgi:uncharacterized protein (TIGR02246 family)
MRRALLFTLALALACATARSTPADTRADDQAIRSLDEKWVASIAAKDLDKTVSFYASDAVMLAPNAPPAQGPDAIRKMWDGFLKTPGLSLTFAPTTIRFSPDGQVAWEVGTYQMAFDTPKGRAQDDGKYLVVWRKTETGEWKAAADTFSSNRPAQQ